VPRAARAPSGTIVEGGFGGREVQTAARCIGGPGTEGDCGTLSAELSRGLVAAAGARFAAGAGANARPRHRATQLRRGPGVPSPRGRAGAADEGGRRERRAAPHSAYRRVPAGMQSTGARARATAAGAGVVASGVAQRKSSLHRGSLRRERR
jgi:hypothetical protein